MTLSIEDIQIRLYDKLIGTGWDHKLRFFVKSSDFYDLILWLCTEKSEGRRFTPSLNEIFKPFQLCQYTETRVVFVHPRPYTDPTLNNGLAISHKFGLNTQFEFRAFYEELQRTIGDNSLMDADLTNWAKQGILLLNTSLTTRINGTDKHADQWRPFMRYVFDYLNRMEGLIFVFFGESEYEELITNSSHTKIRVSVLPNVRKVRWQTDIFKNINKILVDNKNVPISW